MVTIVGVIACVLSSHVRWLIFHSWPDCCLSRAVSNSYWPTTQIQQEFVLCLGVNVPLTRYLQHEVNNGQSCAALELEQLETLNVLFSVPNTNYPQMFSFVFWSHIYWLMNREFH